MPSRIPSALHPLGYFSSGISWTVTANGSSTVDTTQLTIVFSESITSLTAPRFTIIAGTGSATRGSLSGSGTTYILNVSGITPGTITLSLANFSTYIFAGSPKVVTLLGRSRIDFISAVQTGSSGNPTASTGIILTFSQDPVGLVATNITITSGTGSATRGTLTGSGTTRTLSISNVTQGTVTVMIANFGSFTPTPTSRSVTLYGSMPAVDLYYNGVTNTALVGSWQSLGGTITFQSTYIAMSISAGRESYADAVVTSANPINLTGYSSIEVTYSGFHTSWGRVFIRLVSPAISNATNNYNPSGTISLNVNAVNSSAQIRVGVDAQGQSEDGDNSQVSITRIRLIP